MLKILLIDDEKTVLDGLQYMLKKHYGDYEIVDAVQSAARGFEVLREQGDNINLVITDVRMPSIDGIEVIKVLKAEYPHIHTIVLSAHSDYDYVRKTLCTGALDYLLKPCLPSHIIAVLDKVRGLLEDTAVQRRQEWRSQTLERELMEGGSGDTLFEPDTWTQMIAVMSQFGQDSAEALESFIRANADTDAWVSMFLKGVRVFVLGNGNSLSMDELKRAWRQHRTADDYLAVRDFVYGAGNLSHCFDMSMRMLEMAQFNELADILTEDAYEACHRSFPSQLMSECSLQEDFRSFFATGDGERLVEAINIKINRLEQEESPFDPARFKQELIGELMALDTQLSERQICMEDIFGKSIDYLYELGRLRRRETLLNWYKNLCTAVTRHRASANSPPAYIRDAAAYIEDNYTLNLELRDVAGHVFLNEWYFSSQFKKYMGVSFSEYLNNVRIRHAKELLRQRGMKISEVAGLVGFQDQAYFSLVFKRIVKMSPKRYKNKP